jgi:hypothetical protein
MIVLKVAPLLKRSLIMLSILILLGSALAGAQSNEKKEAEVLAAKYPDADVAISEVAPGGYEILLLRDNMQIGSIGGEGGGPSLAMSSPICGRNVVFQGTMAAFVGAKSRDGRSRTINIASLEYDPNKTANPPLAALGIVAVNDSGVVKSDTAKTGWINWGSSLEFDDAGLHRNIRLSDVTFWVNRGGENWLSFSIGDARELDNSGNPGANVHVDVNLNRDGANGRVEVRVGSHSFHPVIKDRQTIVFVAD